MIHNTSLMIFHLRIENKNKILEGIFKKNHITKNFKRVKKVIITKYTFIFYYNSQ